MAMNLLLEEVAAQLPAGTHAAMLIDNAGWHIANDLRVPPNISLVHLPSYSPELNPMKKVWQYLRDRYLSGRLFSGTRAIVDACCDAWNKLTAETGRIRSLTDFEWARRAVHNPLGSGWVSTPRWSRTSRKVTSSCQRWTNQRTICSGS